jgi:23S rRNA (cytosine1962-C5)-methyltransferase
LELIARELLDYGIFGVYLKKRVRADLRQQDALELAPHRPLMGEAAPDHFVVRENALRLSIELHDGLSTGLFVDMRDNRARVPGWLSSNKGREPRMLNLFSYTCSFSVAAALCGAKTTSVDLAGKALQRGRTNFEENGLDPHQHRFFKEDAMKFLARSVRRGDRYDFIVLDPPSFSTVKKGTFSVKNRYRQAAADCLHLLESGGKLLCVTNHTKTSASAFSNLLRDAAEDAGRDLVKRQTLPAGLDCPGHPDGPWPSKSVLLEVR